MTVPECLLARMLKEKYFPDQDLLHASPPSYCSHGWRGIIIGRDLLKHHIGWTIGDGESVSVWRDPWLSTSMIKCPIGPATRDTKFIKVAELFLPNEKDWDAGKVHALLPTLTNKILCLKPSKQGGKG